MGKKYIIEIPEENIGDFIGDTHFLMPYMLAGHMGSHDTGLPIEPYTEPDLEQVRKEAYEAGAKSSAIVIADDKAHEAYQRGLADAWEAARRIWVMPVGDLKKCFDLEEDINGMLWPFHEYTASEAIAKIKDYEDSKREIKVGDEVVGVFSDGSETRPFVFIRGSKEYYFGLYSDTGEFCQGGMNMRKTGRSFPEVAAVLEKMRGETE